MNYTNSKLLLRLSRVVNLTGGKKRSIKAKKNIITGLLIKGCSIAISLIMVPLTIGYVNPSRYGIWLTLSSIIVWFNFFDIGLTKGLRNKFAEALALGEDRLAQTYVSTTYALLAIIFSGVWVLLMIANQFIDWSALLNISNTFRVDISLLAAIVFTYFCLQFVLNTITTVLTADQEPSKGFLIDLLGQFISLIIIVILVRTTEGSLVKLGIALCLSPILVLVASSIFFYRGAYRPYRPKLSMVDFSKARELFNLGLKFFIIQVAGLIQYQTANFIIATQFSTVDVTSYNIAYKYFGILNMVFIIFLTPFWSASTEAFMKNDIEWIKNAMKRYNQLGLLLFFGGIVMLYLADDIYRLWLGKDVVDIDFSLSLWAFLYFAVSLYATKYVFFLNSISALRIQFITSLISPFLYIACTLFAIKYLEWGVYSIFIASLIAGFNGSLIAPVQYYQIIYRSKRGIWIQ